MAPSLEEKINEIKKIFPPSLSQKEKYQKLMELGKKLPLFDDQHKTKDKMVEGCQSSVYLHSRCENGRLYFSASSDALITAGFVYILLSIYNGEKPATILQSDPTFIKDIKIESSLSPNRLNGFTNIYLQMKKIALNYLSNPKKDI